MSVLPSEPASGVGIDTVGGSVASAGSGPLMQLGRRLLAGAAGRIGIACVGLVLLCLLFADVLAPYDPIALNPAQRLQGPGWAHLLGTDQLGRDVLSRVIFGTGTAMTVAFTGVGSALAVGLVLGLVAGYGPRLLDGALMLLCDAVVSLPMMLFALAVVTLVGASLGTIILVVAAFMAPAYFRVVRSQTLVLKRADYVTAARAMGASPLRVMACHLLPNMAGPLLVLIAMDVPSVIAIESGLSFLGQGVQPPTPSWGSILSDGYAFIRQAPHIVLAGGLPIVIATLGFTFLGEALRDALDPRTPGHRTAA